MADPVTLGLVVVPAIMGGISMASSAAGAATSAVGAEYTGRANAAQQNYQARVAEMNARIAKQDANYAIAAGETEAQEIGMKGRAEVGTTEAHFGASNLSLAGPSERNVIASETAITDFNERMARANAAKRAYGYSVGAATDVAQAGAYRAGAETAMTAGRLGVTSSIIGGVGQVSSKWTQGQTAGLWGSSSTPGAPTLYQDPNNPGGYVAGYG